MHSPATAGVPCRQEQKTRFAGAPAARFSHCSNPNLIGRQIAERIFGVRAKLLGSGHCTASPHSAAATRWRSAAARRTLQPETSSGNSCICLVRYRLEGLSCFEVIRLIWAVKQTRYIGCFASAIRFRTPSGWSSTTTELPSVITYTLDFPARRGLRCCASSRRSRRRTFRIL